MSDENLREVFKAHRTIQEKYAFFLLAGAGAAIGFALTRTQGAELTWSQIPLAFAIICWGLSFFFGCRHLQYVSSSLAGNIDLIKVESGTHPQTGNRADLIAAASKGIRDALNYNSDKSNVNAKRQFRSLVIGAVFYIIWHMLEMYLRTIAPVHP